MQPYSLNNDKLNIDSDIKIKSRYKRRSRTTYSKSQLDCLEQTFQKSQYPEIKTVDDLSQTLNLSTERISIWFQNRRARFKKARKLQAQEHGFASNSAFNQTSYSYDTPIMTPSLPYSSFSNSYSNNNMIYPNENLSPSQNYSLMNKNYLDHKPNSSLTATQSSYFSPFLNAKSSPSAAMMVYPQTFDQT